MPTILQMLGWRVFFWSDEREEPIHVHAQKGDCECKFWLKVEEYDIEEAYAFGMSPRLRREIRKIIFDHFELIIQAWARHIEEHRGERN